jgi:ABC-2 type transport system ATP-binding protein
MAAAASILRTFGEPASAPTGTVAVRLAGGASRVAAVIRALDDAGVETEGVELHNPTLDDVFQDATGRRLEGAEATGEAAAVGTSP